MRPDRAEPTPTPNSELGLEPGLDRVDAEPSERDRAEPDRATLDAPRRYVAGLPHHGTRALAAHDRAWIERRLRRLVVGTAAAGLGVVAVLFGARWLPAAWFALAASSGAGVHTSAATGSGLVSMLGPGSGLGTSLGSGFGLGLLLLATVGVVACLTRPGWWRRLAVLGLLALAAALALEDQWPALALPRWLAAELVVAVTVLGLSHLGLHLARRVRVLWHLPRIRADLAAGTVEHFEATRPRIPPSELLARLQRSGHLDRRADRVRLEVLPRSGLLVRAGGRRLDRWETAHVAHVAPAQPHALRVALPRGVAPASPNPRLCLRRRSLTPQERAELQRHIARLRRRWWPAAALTVVVVTLVAYDLRSTASAELLPLGLPFDGASLGWLALLALAYVGYGRRVLAARKLEHDRRLRWVVTVHQDVDSGREPPSLEVLPVSQLAWTERATPAGWRSSRL